MAIFLFSSLHKKRILIIHKATLHAMCLRISLETLSFDVFVSFTTAFKTCKHDVVWDIFVVPY